MITYISSANLEVAESLLKVRGSPIFPYWATQSFTSCWESKQSGMPPGQGGGPQLPHLLPSLICSRSALPLPKNTPPHLQNTFPPPSLNPCTAWHETYLSQQLGSEHSTGRAAWVTMPVLLNCQVLQRALQHVYDTLCQHRGHCTGRSLRLYS